MDAWSSAGLSEHIAMAALKTDTKFLDAWGRRAGELGMKKLDGLDGLDGPQEPAGIGPAWSEEPGQGADAGPRGGGWNEVIVGLCWYCR